MTDEIRNHYGRPLPPLPLPDRVSNSPDPRTEQEKAVTGEDIYRPAVDPRWHSALEAPKGKFYSTDGKWYDTFEEALRNDYDDAEKKLQQQAGWAAQEAAERADEAAREQVAMAKEIAAMHQPPYANANEVYAAMKQTTLIGGEITDMGPNMTATPDGHVHIKTSELLTKRGETHGDYLLHAGITQELKMAMRRTDALEEIWRWKLNCSQREALEMIMHKIGRILAGDPNFRDHWDDIAGYAKLVADQL